MPQHNPTTRTTVALAQIMAMDAAGLPADDVLAHAGFDRATIEDRDARIPLVPYMRLLDLIAEATGDPYFGVRVGFGLTLRDLGVLGFVMANSPTVGDALRNIVRYWRLEIDGTEVDLIRDGAAVHLTYHVSGVSPEEGARESEAAISSGIALVRQLHDPAWKPLEVHLQHAATTDQDELEGLYGAPVYCAQSVSGILFEAALLEGPIRAADPELLPILTAHAEQLLSEMPDADDLVGDVRRHISDGMRDGRPTIEFVADRMAMSARTLQRRLSEEGTSFADLVDDLRRNLSDRYIREPKLAVTEIAFLLGYSEVSAFNRACRRWTGQSPTEFRRAVLAADVV